jgi:hypothetical protein
MNARHPARAIAMAALLFGLGSCQQETVREIDWAKAALARNPDFEIIATDETAGVFTVRDTSTGEVSTLKLGDLIAAPLPGRGPAAPEPSSAPRPEPEPETLPAEAPESPDDSSKLASAQTTGNASAAPDASGTPLAEGPGYRITRGTGNRPEAATEALEGPGYRVERSAQPGATSTGANAPAPEVHAASAERRTDPIICQGDRLMRIDGETIEFTGDAVIAENGCDLYISNARIRAGGVGIIARQARVHIANSTISGMRGSYEASEGAQIYVAQSTFTGVGRRFDGASMTDLGGNSYSTH